MVGCGNVGFNCKHTQPQYKDVDSMRGSDTSIKKIAAVDILYKL